MILIPYHKQFPASVLFSIKLLSTKTPVLNEIKEHFLLISGCLVRASKRPNERTNGAVLEREKRENPHKLAHSQCSENGRVNDGKQRRNDGVRGRIMSEAGWNRQTDS